MEDGLLPESMRYVRKSERNMSPDFYECMLTLCEVGFSVDESMNAFVVISNELYKNDFKIPEEGQTQFDRKTLPLKKTVLKKLSLGQVKR